MHDPAVGRGAIGGWDARCWTRKRETGSGGVFIFGSTPRGSVSWAKPHETLGRKQQIYFSWSRQSLRVGWQVPRCVLLLKESKSPEPPAKALSTAGGSLVGERRP